MKIEIDLSREQLIDILSAMFTISRNLFYDGCSPLGPFNLKSPKERAALEIFSYELHKSIQPTKEEWGKTSFFDQYFSKEQKEGYLKSKRTFQGR